MYLFIVGSWMKRARDLLDYQEMELCQYHSYSYEDKWVVKEVSSGKHFVHMVYKNLFITLLTKN